MERRIIARLHKFRNKSFALALSLFVILVVSGVVLWKKGISFSAVATAMDGFTSLSLAIVLLCACSQIFFMILRVYALMPGETRIGWKSVAEAISYGQLINTFIPARAGDILKVVMFNRGDSENCSLMTGAGVVLADKVVDVIALLLLFVFSGAYRVAESHLPVFPGGLSRLFPQSSSHSFWGGTSALRRNFSRRESGSPSSSRASPF